MQDPVLWLRLMSRYKCTHTQAPNFSLRLTRRRYLAATRKGKAPKDLDLSSLKHFFNAAEPVSASDIDEFVETFSEKAGLKASAIVPGYGLAEHVVYVCDGGKQRLVVNVKELETNQKILVVKENEKNGRVRTMSSSAKHDCITRSWNITRNNINRVFYNFFFKHRYLWVAVYLAKTWTC